MKFVYGLAFLSLIFFTSCKKEKSWDINIKEKNVKLNIYDLSEEFFNDSIPLPTLRKKYPFFFDATTSDSIWEKQRKNKQELHIYDLSKKKFYNFSHLNQILSPIFQRYLYYFPENKIPLIYTYSSGLQNLEYPVMYSQQAGLMFIAMDAYLGTNNKLYDSIAVEKYLQANMDLVNLPSQVVYAIANDIVSYNPRDQKFIDMLIYEGKKLILNDALLVKTPDEYKIGYTPDQLKWSIDNEAEIWNYFIENNYIFASDASLIKRFIDVAPFSKFNNEIEQQSPGRIGAWIGWQIIRKYLKENPDVDLKNLLKNTDSQKIFKESKYKPIIGEKSQTKYTIKTINDKQYHFLKS